MRAVTLQLPVPPSPNRWPSHPMQLHRAKNAYRKKVWLLAIQQSAPPGRPPARARVTVTLWLPRLRDEDNLAGSVKWLLDALRQRQQGKLAWRQGLYAAKGYCVDDDPQHLELKVKQFKGRPARCQVRIEAISREED